jgi:signal peptidase II
MQEMQENPPRLGRLLIIAVAVALFVIVTDQYSKWFVLETVLRVQDGGPGFLDWFTTPRPNIYLSEQQNLYQPDTITSFLNLVKVWNKGISFGMFDVNSASLPWVFVGVALAISSLLLVWMIHMRRAIITIATALIIGGALANTIDRLRFRAVADFIDFHVGDRHWPAFNVADSCIVIGAALLMVDSLLSRHEKVPAGVKNGA